MNRVIVIPALGDNSAYLLRYEKNKEIAIDPPEAGPMLNETKRYHLELDAVLVTHHHWDHSAGVRELRNETNCTVIEGGQSLVWSIISTQRLSRNRHFL